MPVALVLHGLQCCSALCIEMGLRLLVCVSEDTDDPSDEGDRSTTLIIALSAVIGENLHSRIHVYEKTVPFYFETKNVHSILLNL